MICLDDVARFLNGILGLICLMLIVAFILCMLLLAYFYIFPENPSHHVQLTDEQVKQLKAEHQEQRSSRASYFCFAAAASTILGWLTRKPQFQTVCLIFLIVAAFYDYKVVTAALILWIFIVPSLVVAAIVALFSNGK